MNIFNKIKVWLGNMFNKSKVEQKIGINIAQSDKMTQMIKLWKKVYQNEAPWLYDKFGKRKIRSSGIAALVSSYMADLITLEMESSIENDDLDKIYQSEVMENIREYVEFGIALGGVVFKPYQTQDSFKIDIVKADSFLPTSYSSSGDITGCIFFDKFVEGEYYYTRVESHNLNEDDKTYTIINKAFISNDSDDLGMEIQLNQVEKWKNILQHLIINDVEKPLFAYFKPAISNNIEPGSPLGISFFARALEEIQTIDEQKHALRREFRVKEAKQYIDVTAVKDTGELPYNEDDYYIRINSNKSTDDLFESYSPTINEQSFLNALNDYYMNVENMLNLERGVLSHNITGIAAATAKTATEIKMSKHRTYTNVINNQKNLKSCLENLGYAMSIWYQIDKLERTIFNMNFDFDDSVINDPQQQLQEYLLLQNNGNIPAEMTTAWYFGIDENRAREMIPKTNNIIDTLPGVE